MKAGLLLIGLCALTLSVQAVETLHPPGLLPSKIARALLEQDPAVAAARAGLEVASQEARILDSSPYEWTPRLTGQRRRVDNGLNYNEWNLGVERTIRLPGKAVADRDLGKATVEESRARYGEAIYQSARELMAAWVDWLAAERAVELADIARVSVQESLAIVEKRFRAGDASKLDESIGRAELAEQKRLHSDAKTQAAVALSRLTARYPGIPRQITGLPSPLPAGEELNWWRDQILAESAELKVIQAQLRKTQSLSERARSDKLPDPTLGIFTSSESGGQERISGVTISIPLPGGARRSRSAKAIAEVEVSRQEVELKRRRLEAEIAAAVAMARGAYESLQYASEGSSITQVNAERMQQAYALGEADVQALLLARRQSNAAANIVLQAQVVALKAYYGLLIDARLIWELKHE